jgi:nucleotide-binding universal stress UspA family protein
MTASRRPIVVGVDGSPGADDALRWAVGEARLRHSPLRLTHAYRRYPVDARIPLYADIPDVDLELSRHSAEQVLANAVDRASELDAGVEVDGDVISGDPVQVLLGESEHASLLVLGSRHLKALGSAVLGSVSAAVSARAACPAIVVRGTGSTDKDAGVVVGVDGADDADAVLGFAFEHASRHQVSLRALLCWSATSMWQVEPPETARTWLSETLAGWWEKYPDVAVYPEVVREHPVAGLVLASTAQKLLVVGSRGRHALAGTLLGSVSQGVLHHAACPVAVISTHRD